MLGVDRDADDLTGGVGDAGQRQGGIPQSLETGQAIVRQAAHMFAGGFMRQDQRIRLAAVDQRHGHTGIGDVKQTSLPLDVIPVILVVAGGQVFDGTGHEIGDHRIQRHAAAGDQDAGLARGAEGGFEAALLHLGIHGKAGIHLADRTIRAHGKAALAPALDTIGDGIGDRRNPHVEQRAPVHARRRHQVFFVAQKVVQARGDVIPHLQRRDQHILPGLADHPATVGDTDHKCLGTGGAALFQRHVGDPQVRAAPFHPELAHGVLGAPVLDALRDLGGKLVGGITEEEKIGGLDHGGLHLLDFLALRQLSLNAAQGLRRM